MIIYKDLISGDELFTDIYPMESEGCLYKVKGKLTSESSAIDGANFGFNESADGQDEGEGAADSTAKSGINVVLANRLVAVDFDKKSYSTYIKKYLKDLKTKMEKDGSSKESVDAFMKGAQEAIKFILKEFKEWEFYLGESMNMEGMTVLVKWDEETPLLYFFKPGLLEEKV